MARKQKRLKLKTHKATQSRIYVTGTGKLMRLKGHRSHLRRKKLAKVKRQFGQKLPIHTADSKRVKRLLPYSS